MHVWYTWTRVGEAGASLHIVTSEHVCVQGSNRGLPENRGYAQI